ncbi:MAG TPA: type II secretion system protein GspN [Nitrospirota bacterium]|nr:type II secretion system protein GspN [Nitrospirota bacterium]
MIDKQLLIRRASFVAYFTAAFLVFLLLLFPFDQVKAKLESEVRRRTPVELNVSRISPRFFNSYILSDVIVSDQAGKVLFESPRVRTTVSLFGLLRGNLAADLKAKAYGGDLLVKFQQGPGRQYLQCDANGLDIGSYQLLKNFGLKLTGKLGGNFEVTNDTGKGRIWLKSLAFRELKIKGFPIPDMDFEEGWLEADLKGDRLTIRKLEMNGKELKIRGLGDMVLRERGTINLVVKLKPSERLAHEQAGILSLLKNRDAEGYYQFNLGGTLSEPMPRL